jgi:hypothetical protein|tara:strand:+ start:13 stop:228 length:216 start_codon:yes stop_codon:yes gene_type:complete
MTNIQTNIGVAMTQEEYKMPEWQQKNLESYLDIAFKHDKLDRHKVEFIKRYCDNPERLIKKYPLIKKGYIK